MTDPCEARARFEQESRRLRRLARALLREEQGAEDAVQEAWLALLRSREAPPKDRGAWLSATVRRVALGKRRGASRLERRERAAARAERVPAADEELARIEVLRRVLDALEALDEPYRRAVVKRFLDGLPPREIARESGLPVATVRTHVRRGLARLRVALDARCEDDEARRRLLSALAPVALAWDWTSFAGEALERLAQGGAWMMGTKTKAGVAFGAVAALLGCAWIGWMVSRGPEPPRASALAVSPSAALAAADPDAFVGEGDVASSSAELARAAQAPPRPYVLRGLVTLARRAPIPGAPLALRLESAASGERLAEARLVADSDGRFAWSLEAPAVVARLAIRSASEERSLRFDLVLLPGEPAPQELVLNAAALDAALVGRVVDAQGAPIAGATVKTALAETAATSDGRFRLPLASGSSPHQVRVIAPGFALASFAVHHDLASERAIGEVVLRRGSALRGRALDELGRPIEGVEIRSYSIADRGVRSDAEGRFVVDWLRPDAELPYLFARGAGLALQQRELSAAELEAGAFEWTLSRGVRLSGRVREPNGAPVAGAWVVAPDPRATVRLETWTDAEGRFELPPIAPCRATIWAWREGFASTRVEREVPPLERPVAALELELARGRRLAGRIVDERGEPVPFVWIYRDGGAHDYAPACWADAEGRFELTGLAAAPVRLGFLRPGIVRHEERIDELDREDLLVRVARAGALAGRVVDGATGAPLSSFEIELSPGRLEPSERAASLAGAGGVSYVGDGRWRAAGYDGFAIGRVAGLRVSADGYAPSFVDRAVVESEPDPDALVIALFARGAALRGRVVAGPGGAPVEGAQVQLLRGESPERVATTDAYGRYAFEQLALGSARLAVEHPRWARTLGQPFELRAGEQALADLALDPPARVAGRLLDGNGAALAGEAIGLREQEPARGAKSHETHTDDSGAFAFEGLDPGRYTVAWRRRVGERHAQPLSRAVELGPGEAVELELRPLGRASLRGALVGELVPRRVFVLVHAAPTAQPYDADAALERTHSTFALDGRFLLEGLQAGRYELLARADGGAQATALVDVPEEGEVPVELRLGRPR